MDRVELKFTPLADSLDERGNLHLKQTFQPEALTMILVGDWSGHPRFAPPDGKARPRTAPALRGPAS